jgi:hypothetical protein
MQEWPTRQGKKKLRRAVGLPPDPSGQARFWCPRPDPNRQNRTDSDTKMSRPAGDALREWWAGLVACQPKGKRLQLVTIGLML